MEHSEWSVLEPCEVLVEDPASPGGTKIIHRFSKSIDRKLLDGLAARETMLWRDIFTQNGGRKGGTNSHNIQVSDMARSAQARITELNLDVDELFSMRISGLIRVFGVLEEGVLDVIWFDRNHEVCPTAPR